MAVALVALTALARAATAADLETGIRQVNEGDFEAAVLTLDEVARASGDDPVRAGERARAYVYLGLAYLGLEQRALAQAKFREALKNDPDLILSAERFPARAIRVFDAARRELRALERPQKRSGSKLPFVLLGGGLATTVAAVTLAGGGGQEEFTPAIDLTASTPGDGSTVTLPAFADPPMMFTFVVGYTSEVPLATLRVTLLSADGRTCFSGESPVFVLAARQRQTVVVDTAVGDFLFWDDTCPPPSTTTRMTVELRDQKPSTLLSADLARRYTFIR